MSARPRPQDPQDSGASALHRRWRIGRGAGRAASLVWAWTLVASGCDTTVQGDGGEAPSSAGSSSGQPCGTEGGVACVEGASCDPDLSCNDFLLACYRFTTDCTPVHSPVCERRGGDCPMYGEKSCGCSGEIRRSDCAQMGDQVAPDPARCSKGTFDCGAHQCRTYLDVCVGTGAEPVCVAATALGCTRYGIADCFCLSVTDGEVCIYDAHPGEVRIQASEAARPEAR